MNNHINTLIRSTIVLLFMGLSFSMNADDIDFLKSEVESESNILFVMDMSGSMKWGLNDYNVPANPANSRKNILQSALQTVLNDPLLTGVNVGVSSFAGDASSSAGAQTANGVSYPISPIDGASDVILSQNPLFTHKGTSHLPVGSGVSSRAYISTKVPSTWTPVGGTPIVDALYEAALYYRGMTVDGGREDPSHIRSAHPSSYNGLLQNVTTMVPTPTNQYCGFGSYPACNGTETIPCPISTGATNCYSASCIATREAQGYTCGAQQSYSYNYSCNLSQCNSNAGCNVSSATTNTYTNYVNCGLGNPTACEAANPTYSACHTVTNNTPGYYTSGACITWNDAGTACLVPGPQVWHPPVNSSYIRCTRTTTYTRYSCPNTINYTRCEKSISRCVHTNMVDVPHTTLQGTATYASPIKKECSSNSIILLTDGQPTLNASSGKVTSLIGSGYANSCSAGTDKGRCGPQLTKFLNSVDQSAAVTGDQKITTHAIGFALSDPTAAAYLGELANNGGGQFVNAATAGGLVSALKGAVFGGTPRARTFSAPTYTPNQSAMMTHSDDVYLPIFDRGFGSSWTGNLKKFKRANGKLMDADGGIATDEFGGLKDDARDYWSVIAPTHVVKGGGAAGNIDPVQRTSGAIKVYTDNGSTYTSASFTTLNNSIPNAEFGTGVSTALKGKLVKFIMGKKADGTARHHMGDIIHSKPVVVSYGTKKVVFIGTNEGYLHAIDDETGQELFAFMPRELLKNIKPQYDNAASGAHIYGVDGQITLWHDDTNSNNIVDNSEKAFLYFGLRRGGKSYYAIDITNRTSPELKWKIDNTASDYSSLGFTWSQPVLTTMKYKKNGTVISHPEPLLIFGGGYVDDHAPEAENSGTGSNVYVVDALTGERRWKSPDSAISYAVPAGIRVLDVDRNGSADRLYFGDTGGNVWRVDFTSTNLSNAIISKFADLGSVSLPATETRRFFAEPDVALFKKKGSYTLTVSIGSGQRPSPMDASGDDHFFVMFDKHPLTPPPVSTPAVTITKSDLVDATTSPALNIASSGKKGWYIDLTNVSGEKVLSRALTYENKIMFSTFGGTSGAAPTPPSCLYQPNTEARLYVLDLLTGGPVIDFDANGTPEASKKTAVGEIPGPAQVVFNPLQNSSGGSCVKGDCNRPDEVSVGKGHNSTLPPSNALQRVYWIDK